MSFKSAVSTNLGYINISLGRYECGGININLPFIACSINKNGSLPWLKCIIITNRGSRSELSNVEPGFLWFRSMHPPYFTATCMVLCTYSYN